MNKYDSFYRMILAWQSFGGVSLRVTDSARVLTDEDVTVMKDILTRLASTMKTEDKERWPDIHRAADKIIEQVKKM